MFCIKCGGDAFKDNLCEKCFLEKKELFTIKPIKIRRCPLCKKYYTQMEKVAPEHLGDFIEGKIIATGRIKDVSIHVNEKIGIIEADITATGTIAPSKILINDTKKIKIIARAMMCENCVKKSGNYHEAVIQVRGDDKERILKKIGRMLKRDEIANIRLLKEGYDLLVISKGPATKAAKALSEKYNVKASYKLMGEKKGSKIYRNYYCIK